MKSYKIGTLIGKTCMTPDDGMKVYELTYPELRARATQAVDLDFAGVKRFLHLRSSILPLDSYLGISPQTL